MKQESPANHLYIAGILDYSLLIGILDFDAFILITQISSASLSTSHHHPQFLATSKSLEWFQGHPL